jgi:hypothetical protein
MGIGSIAILSSADGYGQAGAGVVKEGAEAMDMTTAAGEEFGPEGHGHDRPGRDERAVRTYRRALRAWVTKGGRGRGARHSKDRTLTERRAAMTWAQRLKRVFSIDIETCSFSGCRSK